MRNEGLWGRAGKKDGINLPFHAEQPGHRVGPGDLDTISNAASRGQLETLRWARENGCDWNVDACLHAAYGGHLEVLQFLRANDCPWDHWTCYMAVEYGHLETLRWARENGCPWRASTRDRAAAKLGYTDDLGNLLPAIIPGSLA